MTFLAAYTTLRKKPPIQAVDQQDLLYIWWHCQVGRADSNELGKEARDPLTGFCLFEPTTCFCLLVLPHSSRGSFYSL